MSPTDEARMLEQQRCYLIARKVERDSERTHSDTDRAAAAVASIIADEIISGVHVPGRDAILEMLREARRLIIEEGTRGERRMFVERVNGLIGCMTGGPPLVVGLPGTEIAE